MIDASKYDLVENIKITKEVVEYATTKGASIEAEIGHIGGSEDGVSAEILHAKVEDCVKLVTSTNLTTLAPALGSVHGIYKGEPNLNFERMLEISEKTNLPLVLHGGTGIPDDKIRKARSEERRVGNEWSVRVGLGVCALPEKTDRGRHRVHKKHDHH